MRAMETLARVFAHFRSSPRRGVLVEAAFLTPAFLLLAVGGFEWGGYLWLQHQVQSAADRALAVALAAPNPAYSQDLAQATVEQALGGQADVSLDSGPRGPMLRVTYDASSSPIFAIRRFVPLPPSMIVRLAAAS